MAASSLPLAAGPSFCSHRSGRLPGPQGEATGLWICQGCQRSWEGPSGDPQPQGALSGAELEGLRGHLFAQEGQRVPKEKLRPPPKASGEEEEGCKKQTEARGAKGKGKQHRRETKRNGGGGLGGNLKMVKMPEGKWDTANPGKRPGSGRGLEETRGAGLHPRRGPGAAWRQRRQSQEREGVPSA